MSNFRTKFHRNGEVTFWNVFTQQWQREPVTEVHDAILATLPEKERNRIIKAAERETQNDAR